MAGDIKYTKGQSVGTHQNVRAYLTATSEKESFKERESIIIWEGSRLIFVKENLGLWVFKITSTREKDKYFQGKFVWISEEYLCAIEP